MVKMYGEIIDECAVVACLTINLKSVKNNKNKELTCI